MSSFEYEQSPREPVVRYAPIFDYNGTYQQLSMLESMGYPVSSQTVRNDDAEMHRFHTQRNITDIMMVDAPVYPYWAKFNVDPIFDESCFEYLDSTGDIFKSEDDLELNRLITGHPVRLIGGVELGQVSALHTRYITHISGQAVDVLAHEREDFPWAEVYERSIVAAYMQHQKMAQEFDMCWSLAEHDPWAERFANSLIAKGIEPLNGEQVAGMVSDYYMLIEKHFPRFRIFKNCVV